MPKGHMGELKDSMASAEIPPADVTVSERILALAPGRNGRPVLIDSASGFVISYSSFAATVRAAASGLMRRGVRPGDVVGVYLAGPVSFALASHAVRVTGAVPSPMIPATCPHAVAARLAACDARMLITDGALACAAQDVAEQSRVRQVICFGHASDTTRFDALLNTGTMRPVPRTATDLALLAWASAPTAAPQPVRVTHGELGAELRRLAAHAKLAAWDIIVAPPPCGDGRGYSALLDFALAVGATVVGAPSTDPGDVLAVARSHRGTVAFVAPGTELTGRFPRRIFVRP